MYRNNTTLILAVSLVGLMQGCTTQDWYNQIQHKNERECSKAPPHQYQECMERIDTTFDEYKRQREEALGH